MHPSNRADCFPFPPFSSLFDFSAWENAPRKSKSGLAKPAFPRFAPRRARPVFYRRGRNVCILRTAPIVSPSRFLAVFSIFQRGKSLPYKSKSGLAKPAFPRFARAGHTPFFIGGATMYASFESRLLFLPFPLFSSLFDFSAWKIAPLQKQKRPRAAAAFCAISR